MNPFRNYNSTFLRFPTRILPPISHIFRIFPAFFQTFLEEFLKSEISLFSENFSEIIPGISARISTEISPEISFRITPGIYSWISSVIPFRTHVLQMYIQLDKFQSYNSVLYFCRTCVLIGVSSGISLVYFSGVLPNICSGI